MKHKTKKYLLLVITVLGTTTVSLCQKNTSRQNAKLFIEVDERMELLTTVQFLANYDLLCKADLDYKKEITQQFSRFKNHPLFPLLKSINDQGYLWGSAPVWYIYQFSFPDFKPLGKIEEDEIQIEDYKLHFDTLQLFKKQLHDFYVKSNFHTFFKAHQLFYKQISDSVRTYLMKTDIVNRLENHYGETKHSYHVVLTPLLHSGGFGVQVHAKNGTDIFGIVGPTYDSKNIPHFPPEIIFQNIVIHEFSHSFCNLIIKKNMVQLIQDTCLVDTIFESQDKQGYGGDWETCLYEHLTRANEIVLCKQLLGPEKAALRYNKYFVDLQWIYLKGLIPLIEEEYLTHRSKYKTEYDLMPKVIEYLNEEKKVYCH